MTNVEESQRKIGDIQCKSNHILFCVFRLRRVPSKSEHGNFFLYLGNFSYALRSPVNLTNIAVSWASRHIYSDLLVFYKPLNGKLPLPSGHARLIAVSRSSEI